MCVQGATSDTEYMRDEGGAYQAPMDFLGGPVSRQRALSVASIITNTMEGRTTLAPKRSKPIKKL